MKIIRIVPTLPLFQPFYDTFNSLDLSKFNYEEVANEFSNKKIYFPVNFCSSMKKLGHDSWDIFYDFPQLQKKWCQENDKRVDFTEQFWSYRCLEKQIEFYKPDVLFFERCATGFLKEFYEGIRRNFPFLKVLCGTISWELTDPSIFESLKQLHLVFGGDELITKQLRSFNINSEVLDLSFDGEDIIEVEKKHDLTFIGSSGYGFCDSMGNADHYQRYHDLLMMMKKTPIRLWCYEIPMSQKYKLYYRMMNLAKNFPDGILKYFPSVYSKIDNFFKLSLEVKNKKRNIPWHYNKKSLQELFPKRVHQSIFGKEYLKTIAQSKISFNRHVDNPGHGGNKRCYEVTGMGSCLLCDREKQISHLFEPDKEAIYYSTIEEAIDKAKYLLNNENVLKEIAKNGQKRTLKDHTYFSRCKTIIKHLQRLL